MENVVFVYVDKPRIDAFMELLTEDGYTKVTDVDLGVEQYFSINTKEKMFLRILTCSTEKVLTVEDFIDLFI
jgi:hypothetical protein